MTFDISIDGIPYRFGRNWFHGRATLSGGGQTHIAQSPWDPSTHISTTLTRCWLWRINDRHELLIEKVRPLFFAGVRPQTYRAYLDDELVLERTGY